MKKKKKLIWIVVSILILASIAWSIMANKKPKIEYTTVKPNKGELIQTVSETGSVKPLNELSLNFLASGRISELGVKVGDQVKKDQILAAIDSSDLEIRKIDAQAKLLTAKAQLSKLLSGASNEDKAVASASLQSAQAAYDSAAKELDRIKQSLNETVSQAEKSYSDLASESTLTPLEQGVAQAKTNLDNTKRSYSQAIDNQKDSLIVSMNNKTATADAALDAVDRIISDDNYRDLLGGKDSSLLPKTKNYYLSARDMMEQAEKSLSTLNDKPSLDDVKKAYKITNSALNEVFRALSYCFNTLEKSVSGMNFPQSTLDSFKSNISNQSTLISTAISALQAGRQALDDANLSYNTATDAAENSLRQAQVALDDAKTKASNSLSSSKLSREQQLTSTEGRVDSAAKALKVAQAQYDKTMAPPRSDDVTLQKLQINQAEANIELINNQISNNKIKAPVDGIVTEVNFKLGEQSSMSQEAIKMNAQDGYEIEIDVAETDIAKVKTNNPAVITLDAYGDDLKLEGRVSFIDPAQTVIQGVIYYKVKIDFMAGNTEIKPGMTATAEVTTNKKADVISVPYRAVIDSDGKKIVRVLRNGSSVDVPVELGLSGDGGMIEIKNNALSESDDVITFTKNNDKKTTSK